MVSTAGQVSDVHGIALASHLAEQRVSERMASTCEEQIRAAGMACEIDRVDDVTAVHAGACLAIWAKKHRKLVRRRPSRKISLVGDTSVEHQDS